MSPDQFDALWDEFHPPARPRQPVNGSSALPGGALPYARAAYDGELATLWATAEGGRNEQLNKSCFNLGQLVAAGHLDRATTYDALYAMGLAVGLTVQETTATVTSGLRAGEMNPRQVAAEHSPGPPGPTTVFEPEQLDLSGLFPLVDWLDQWDKDDGDDWLLEPLVPARRLTALFSPPKVGKSLLMLELAVGLSRGEPVLGRLVDGPHRVLYVDFENDPRGDVIARLKAMGREAADLDALLYLSYPRLPYLDTPAGGHQLLAVAQHYRADVVIIDTIGRCIGGEENANDTWLNFYRHTGLALKAAGITTVRLDHTGKDLSKGMRGGSAKYGDVDLVWSMTPIGNTGKLQLECTAHRLPVSCAQAVLRRDTDPLRHVWEGQGVAAVMRAKTGDRFVDMLTALQELWGLEMVIGSGGPAPTKAAAEKALRARGFTGDDKLLRAAIQHHNETIQSESLDFTDGLGA